MSLRALRRRSKRLSAQADIEYFLAVAVPPGGYPAARRFPDTLSAASGPAGRVEAFFEDIDAFQQVEDQA